MSNTVQALEGINKVTINGHVIDIEKLLEEAKIIYWKENEELLHAEVIELQ